MLFDTTGGDSFFPKFSILSAVISSNPIVEFVFNNLHRASIPPFDYEINK